MALRLSNPHTITIIGANGAGKTRFGEEIERTYADDTMHLSALHALAVKPSTTKTVLGKYSIPYLYTNATGENIGQLPKSEFEQLLFLLQQEELASLVSFKEEWRKDPTIAPIETVLDKVQKVWEELFPNTQLMRNGSDLMVRNIRTKSIYSVLHMSQGEQVVFFMLAASLLVAPHAIVVVEEPESHLHRSITASLWNLIEQQRPNCTFVYLTHDLEFAASRTTGERLWIKSHDAEEGCWEYEKISSQDNFTEELYLELLGSRKPILFIEGTDHHSIDSRLYPYIFSTYHVKPVGGCTKVIETTRTFADMGSFHHIESKGIVDRDRRTKHEVESLRKHNIFVPEVAEVENLLMLEGVIRVVARRMLQDENKVFAQVKQNVITLFCKDIESQALLHTRHQLKRKIEVMIDKRLHTIEEFATHIEQLTSDIDTHKRYNAILLEFRGYAATSDYQAILRVYNQKGMLPQSNLTQLCGIANKERYLSFIISLLKEDGEDATVIRTAIVKAFNMEESLVTK